MTKTPVTSDRPPIHHLSISTQEDTSAAAVTHSQSLAERLDCTVAEADQVVEAAAAARAARPGSARPDFPVAYAKRLTDETLRRHLEKVRETTAQRQRVADVLAAAEQEVDALPADVAERAVEQAMAVLGMREPPTTIRDRLNLAKAAADEARHLTKAGIG